jgi:hypothetical protein
MCGVEVETVQESCIREDGWSLGNGFRSKLLR